MKRLSDEEIIAGLRKRDNRILQYIYKNSFPPVKQLILHNAGSESDAKDIFQEALIVIFKKLRDEDSLKLEAAFSTYTYSIARLLCFLISLGHYVETRVCVPSSRRAARTIVDSA